MKPISLSNVSLTENEIQAVLKVLRSGNLRQGKECEAFEEEFRTYTGAGYAIACSSGSAALHLAYMTILQPEDEVLIPSFTFIATASMVTLSGGIPVFCDVDPETFLIDMKDAEKKISRKTKAIAPVHLFGNVCKYDTIRLFADEHNLKVVWDAAQAHGGMEGDRDIGSFGDFTCYSFYPSKNMFVGEGGMICTDNPEYAEKVRHMRSHGQTGKYLHTMIGLNYRMTDAEAAIGRVQLKRLDEMLQIRRRNAKILIDGLTDLPGVQLQTITPNTAHAWHQFCIVIDSGITGYDRDKLSRHLSDMGISSGVHYPRGLHQQPIFQELYGSSNLPNTEFLAENILAIPVHHDLEKTDLFRIVQAISSL